MTRCRAALIALALLLIAIRPGAQSPVREPFGYERPIVTTGPGPFRLPIDVPLLAGSKPFSVTLRSSTDPDGGATAAGGLGDLRLFDSSGTEIPYLLVARQAEPDWRTAAILPVAPFESEKLRTSGFEADLGEASIVDRLRIDGLTPPFVKRVRLEGSGDRSHWTLLVDEGTLFDLPESRLRQIELEFASGSYRYLRVTWDDTRSGRVGAPGAVLARVVSASAPPPALTTPIAFEKRPSEPGRSRYHLRLAAARLPLVALEFDVAAGHVMRDVEVFEARLSGPEAAPAQIGRGTLMRVERDDLAAEALRVRVQPPAEPELDVVIDDGDNPPLELRGITARFAELPWIYVEAANAAVARYGNPSMAAPRYDLEAVRRSLRIDSAQTAAWGEPRARTDAENDAAPAPPLPIVGAPIDARGFSFVRSVMPGDGGLVAIRLDEAVLAHSQSTARFADLRVIDTRDRQVPYLLERLPEPLSVAVALERVETPPRSLGARPSESVYRLRWQYDRLPASRLVLTTSARVFQRSVGVKVERAPDRRRRDPWIESLASASWTHAAQETAAPALTMLLPEVAARELLVTVAEGDNSPLPIATARLLFPQFRIRFFREPRATLRLAYGRTDLPAPSYDLTLLAPRLLGVPASEAAVGPEGEATRDVAPSLISVRTFWWILGASVVILLGLIARLIKAQT